MVVRAPRHSPLPALHGFFVSVVLLLCASPSMTQGASLVDESFLARQWEQAVAAYQEQDYKGACDGFEAIIEGGVQHPTVYFNLGNTYHQLGRPGRAAWMYEKSLRMAPRHRDARHNLELVRRNAAVVAPESFFLFRPVAWVYGSLSAGEWLLLFLCGYAWSALAAMGWILSRRSGRLRSASRFLTIVGLCLMVLAGCFLVPRHLRSERARYAVVVESGMIVRSAPREDADEYFEAPESQRLELLGASAPGWQRVKNPLDGRVGFLPQSSLAPI